MDKINDQIDYNSMVIIIAVSLVFMHDILKVNCFIFESAIGAMFTTCKCQGC